MNPADFDKLPYPWNDRSGLSRVIDDPSLWALAFSDERDTRLRHVIKRAAKHVFRKVSIGIICVDDDDSFGRAAVRVVSSPEGRKALKEEQLDPEFLSSYLLNAISVRYGEILPDFDEFAPENSEGHRKLDLAKLAEWLKATPLEENVGLALAAMLCAFAIRDSSTLRESLRNSTTAIPDLFRWWKKSGDDEIPVISVVTEPPDTHATSANRLTKGTAHKTEGEIQTLLPSSFKSDELTVTEWRSEIVRLRTALALAESRLTELEHLSERVAAEAIIAQTLPWLREPLLLGDVARLREGATVSAEIARLQASQASLARLVRAHAQAEALSLRLGRSPMRVLAGGGARIEEVATELEYLSSELGAEADAIARVIDEARGFLDRLAAGDVSTAIEICSGAPMSTWLAVARVLYDPLIQHSEIEELRSQLANDHIAAVLIAQTVLEDPGTTVEIVRWLFGGTIGGEATVRRAEILFSFLTFEELSRVATATPAAAEAGAALIFAAALRQNRAELLEHLARMLDVSNAIAMREFYRALVDFWRRGWLQAPGTELRGALIAGDQSRAAEAAAEKARRELFAWLDSPPGLKKMFHRLRVFAQAQFLHPLRAAIEARDSDAARRQWERFGSIESMVEQCVAHLKQTDRPEPRHYEQTGAYLEGFAADLESWARAATGSVGETRRELVEAVARLRAEAGRNSWAAVVLRLIEAGETLDFPMSGFAERRDESNQLRAPRIEQSSWIMPTMLATWPRIIEGDAYLVHCLVDTFRNGLTGALTLAAAIEAYLSAGQLEAARSAAAGDIELSDKVESVFRSRRQALVDAHADLLAEVERAADLDPFASECLTELHEAINADDFERAEKDFELLSDWLAEYRRRHDPALQSLSEWLREAGVEPPSEATVEELNAQCEKVRATHARQRSHIRALTDAASNSRAPEPVASLWLEAAPPFDRPRLWPDADTSEFLAEAIRIIAVKLQGKWHLRVGDEDPSAAVVSRIAEWLPDRLTTGLSSEGPEPFEPILKLTEMLDGGSGDAALLRFLGSTGNVRLSNVAFGSASKSPPATVSHRETLGTAPTAQLSRSGLLVEMLANEPAAPAADFNKLRLAALAGRWTEARSLAAALYRAPRQGMPDSEIDLQAVYGAAMLAESTGAPEWLPEAVAAVLESRRVSHFLGEEKAAEFAPRAFLRVMPAERADSLAQRLAASLQSAADLPGGAPAFLQVSEFIRALGSSAPRMAEVFWEVFTGLSRRDQPRAALLRLLFRLRELAALRRLVDRAADKVQPVIRACLDAFATAETQPEARPAALQLSSALRTQAAGLANTLPWVHLFHSIESVRDETEVASVEVSLDSDFATDDAAGGMTVEVRVKPSLFDPPSRLSLRLAEGAPFPLHDEPLYSERVVRVPLPLGLNFGADGEVRLPFSVDGETVGASAQNPRTIALTGSWTVVRAERAEPIEAWRIEMLWPGAKRDPVLRNHGFFGRNREMREVEARLKASPRARSVMLFGERRIGKTSVIRNLIASFPPARGRLCGAFCDVSGLHPEPDRIAARFFERIASALTVESDNAPVVEALRAEQGHFVSAKELMRGLNPEVSLYAALEGLAQRLEELSGGVISRIALFIDEFDLFVVPMIGERREEVNRLMWELRQTIQRSGRLALILSGSGLQRLYKENYQDALYGSIDEVTLSRFDWNEDRSAILDTFLPNEVRMQLCREADVESVARRAVEICAGHPMFLALLGSAAAKVSEGRRLTPGFLDRVVAAMMRERGLIGGETIERQVFYGFIFDQLAVVPAREGALAKELLATLAQHTLPEERFSSLRIHRLFEISGLPAKTGELLQALDRLAKIDSVQIDRVAGRVRISVPLTAAATREDAPRLREEARERLRSIASENL